MNTTVLNTYLELIAIIENIPALKNLPVKNPAKVTAAVKAANDRLKKYYTENPFTDPQSQINYFKYEKPKIDSEHIYVQERYTTESNKPLSGEDHIRTHYEQELRYIRRTLEQNRYLYQYYQLDGTEFDEIYFTINNRDTGIYLPDSNIGDPGFSTPASQLFARFIALERLQEHLTDQLHGHTEQQRKPFTSKKGRTLRWTGDKSNLVELAYGIHDTLQLNDGEADLADIIDWLEDTLQINLGRYYQTFSDIKLRKAVSHTRYIDHMQEMVTKHIEDGDAFQPQKPKPVSGSKVKQEGTPKRGNENKFI